MQEKDKLILKEKNSKANEKDLGMEREKDTKQKKKILGCAIVALAVGIIIELICSKGTHVFTKFSFSRSFIISGLICFIFLHFILNMRKMYDFIIKRRFSLSIIMIVVTTVLELFQSSYGITTFLFS